MKLNNIIVSNNYKWVLKNLHLLISLAIVWPTALIYGSSVFISKYFEIQINTIDLSNLMKAIMCLYLGISLVWLLGIIKLDYWKSATQLNIVFMFSLATGRLLSMITDGSPTGAYIFAIMVELLMGIFSIYQLKKYDAGQNQNFDI